MAAIASLQLYVAGSQAQPPVSNPEATSPPQTQATPSTTAPDSLAMGETVKVTALARRRGPFSHHEVLTSTNVLTERALQTQSTAEPLNLLKRAPGVYMENYQQGVVTAGIGIRGFNTQGDVPAVRLSIDGIPSNLHVGVPELKTLFPFEIERIEVVKGTNDPRYGINNVAGNINVTTRNDEQTIARLVGGSFGTSEPQVYAGLRTGQLQHSYFVGYRTSAGFRVNSAAKRLVGSAKWFYDSSPNTRFGVILRGMGLNAEAPGYLSRREARHTPAMAVDYATNDRGKERAFHASAHLDHDANSLSFQFKTYLQTYLRKRYVRFDHAFSQQLRTEDELQYGAIGVVTYRPQITGIKLAFDLGADILAQDNLHQRYNTIVRTKDGPPTRDHHFTFNTAGAYAQAIIEPFTSLKLVAALRMDHLFGDFRNALSDEEFPMHDYGVIWQPKLSASWTPAQGQRIYANYGRSFQVNTGIGAYATSTGTLLKPSVNDGWEAGIRSKLGGWLRARVAVWQQLASQEVRLKFDNSGESENIGKTKRYGLDVEATVQPVNWLSIWGGVSPVAAKQTAPGGLDATARRGKTLNNVPAFSAKVGIDYSRYDDLWISLWMHAQGSYYITPENTESRVGDYWVLNLDASYPLRPWLALGLAVHNLLDNRYAASVWHKNFGDMGAQYSPGAPLSLFASANLTL